MNQVVVYLERGRCVATIEDGSGKEVSRCSIGISRDHWMIQVWKTDESLRRTGLGTAVMKAALCECYKHRGMPLSVKYTWNGTNQYVLDWLERNFDAKCDCPIAIMKNDSKDDKSSHIYTLDVDSVLEYMRR